MIALQSMNLDWSRTGGVVEQIHTLLTRKLRRSVEFLTNSDFLAKVELSLSLRFNWQQKIKKSHCITE
jgi:hypothetical protein